MREKLERYTKEGLVSLVDVLDIHISRAVKKVAFQLFSYSMCQFVPFFYSPISTSKRVVLLISQIYLEGSQMCQPETESLWLAAYIVLLQLLNVMVRMFLAFQKKLLSVRNS